MTAAPPTTRFALINPNTNAAATSAMVEIAREAAGAEAEIEGFSAPFGASLITTPAALAEAAKAVLSLAGSLRGRFDGVLVSAFGDPALEALRALMDCPATGIAEAGMAAAGADGRPFAVVTTTPHLADSIADLALRYGHEKSYRGIRLTEGDPAIVHADTDRLLAALEAACLKAIAELGAEAIVIGGGPLARAARHLKTRFSVPIIEPVPEAVKLALRRRV